MMHPALRSSGRRSQDTHVAMLSMAAGVNHFCGPPERGRSRVEEGTKCLDWFTIGCVGLTNTPVILVHHGSKRRISIEVILDHHMVVMRMIDGRTKMTDWDTLFGMRFTQLRAISCKLIEEVTSHFEIPQRLKVDLTHRTD